MTLTLPRSAIIVLESLTREGPLTPRDLKEHVDLAPRTLTLALRTLFEARIILKTPNLMDMRQPVYHVNIKRVRELRIQFESDNTSRVRPSVRPHGPSGTFTR
ncbi:MAG: hypothetical protein ACP6KW_01025 [Candidatus Thorarchaeota archaeon]